MLRIAADAGGNVISTDPDVVDPFAHRLQEPMSGRELLARYRETTTQVREIYEAGMDRLAGGSAA